MKLFRHIYEHNFQDLQYTVGFLRRFDTSFGMKIMVKIYATEIIFKFHEPL